MLKWSGDSEEKVGLEANLKKRGVGRREGIYKSRYLQKWRQVLPSIIDSSHKIILLLIPSSHSFTK